MPNELFALLSGWEKFTKIDLKDAFLQIELDDVSKVATTINTHKGLFQFNRMPFGIASAPAIFQKTMGTMLQGLRHVAAYIDDIIVTGKNDAEHMSNLHNVLQRFFGLWFPFAVVEMQIYARQCGVPRLRHQQKWISYFSKEN